MPSDPKPSMASIYSSSLKKSSAINFKRDVYVYM